MIWKKTRTNCILIVSNSVIHRQILISSVFKIASLFSLRTKRCYQSLHLTIGRTTAYAPRDKRKHSIAADRLLRCCPTFSKSLMVSVAVSKLGCSPLFFVEPGVKVDGRYYRDVLLKQQMRPVMQRNAGGTYTCSSRIASQLTVLATLSSYCSRRLQSSLHPTCGSQTAQEPGRLPCLGSHAGTSLQNCSAWHSWPQAASHWDLVGHSTDCHRQSHWRVEATTTSLRQSKGTSLRALAVTNRLFSEPPNASTQQLALLRGTHILSK